jgi:hypothetical protein
MENSMPHFWTCAGPIGAGKTFAATAFASEHIPLHDDDFGDLPPDTNRLLGDRLMDEDTEIICAT